VGVCCWTVFIVSKGARIVLEQAAARPEARVFLSPSVMAEDDAFCLVVVVTVDVEDALLATRPPRGMVFRMDDDDDDDEEEALTWVDGVAWSKALLLVMLNNPADVKTVWDDRRKSEKRIVVVEVLILLF